MSALYRLASQETWEHCFYTGDEAHRTLLWGDLETHTEEQGLQLSTMCDAMSVSTSQSPDEHDFYPVHAPFFREVAVGGVSEDRMLETLGVVDWPDDIQRTLGGESGRVRTLDAWLDALQGTLLIPGSPGLSVDGLRTYFEEQSGGGQLGRADTFAPEITSREDRIAFSQTRLVAGPPRSRLSAVPLLRDGEKHYLLIRHDSFAAESIVRADIRGALRRRIVAENLRPVPAE